MPDHLKNCSTSKLLKQNNPLRLEQSWNNHIKVKQDYHQLYHSNIKRQWPNELQHQQLSADFSRNKSLSTGKYPSYFKKSIVIPLFKAGNKLQCGNFRPISKSLTLSKNFEKCIKNRILDFLNKKCFFSKCQFGFRPGLSTTDALFEVDNFVRNNIDNNDKVMGIFFRCAESF